MIRRVRDIWACSFVNIKWPNPALGSYISTDVQAERLRIWDKESTLTIVWTVPAYEDGLCEYVDGHECGQIAFVLLKELYESVQHTENHGTSATKMPLYYLSSELAKTCKTLTQFNSRIGILAKKCEGSGYDFLEWML